MGNVQRYVGFYAGVIPVPVDSGVTVDKGDLMFLDNSDDLRVDGNSTATYKAYPLSYLRISGASLELNKRQVKARFIGVAVEGKDGIGDGNSQIDNIGIATSGEFVFDLKPAKTVYPGKMFGPTGTTTGSDIYNQKVMLTADVTNALGYFTEYKAYATSARVFLRTAFGATGLIT